MCAGSGLCFRSARRLPLSVFWRDFGANHRGRTTPESNDNSGPANFPDLENSRNRLWWAGKGSSLVDRKHSQCSQLRYAALCQLSLYRGELAVLNSRVLNREFTTTSASATGWSAAQNGLDAGTAGWCKHSWAAINLVFA